MARKTPGLSHVGPDGRARMVDISAKPVTAREAQASAIVRMKSEVLDSLMAGTLVKGDALSTARIAGIMGAKKTAELIPMCHNMALEWVNIDFERVGAEELRIVCTARTLARTGVEMEALTGASVAALTIYDMGKSADKSMTIGPIQLERKSGGKSGEYRREQFANSAKKRSRRKAKFSKAKGRLKAAPG